MSDNIIDAVLKILNRKEETKLNFEIEALKSEILSYLNRDDITDELFPVMCTVIADMILQKEQLKGSVLSVKEGDLSVTYSSNSPFFGRLEGFKLIRGIKTDV